MSAPYPRIQYPKFDHKTSPKINVVNNKSFLPFENTLNPLVNKNIQQVFAQNIYLETQEEVIHHKVKISESSLKQDQIKNRMKIKKAPVEIPKYN